MIIDCVGCLHGHYPKLDGGDLLIVTGDLTARDEYEQYEYFMQWLEKQKFKQKIIIAGNHDNKLDDLDFDFPDLGIQYLCDSGTEFEGLKIWGSPWTEAFEGINPHCMAFTSPYAVDTEGFMEEKFSLIPSDTDILITHGPPFGILDKVNKGGHVGDLSLRDHVMGRIKPKIHVFSHVHECGGKVLDSVMTKFINCSIMNEHYQPVNKPIRINL